jgi:predicted TIM-barrel fold metal-dependent hydrolase
VRDLKREICVAVFLPQVYATTQLESSLSLVRRFPSITFMLNHAGMPIDRDAANIALWRTNMSLLGREPNVNCKLSGLGMCDNNFTAESLRPFVFHLLEAFGSFSLSRVAVVFLCSHSRCFPS